MKALSILQPYAWLIVHGHKDIENRSWMTGFRGRFLVHAGKSYSRVDHQEYSLVLADRFGVELPRYEEMPRGAIVGAANLVDCVREHPSRWKDPGSWGFLLAAVEAFKTPVPYRGQLNFFDVPDSAWQAST